MFLHIIAGDSKFPRLIREMFESVDPGNHCYAIIPWAGVSYSADENFNVIQNKEDLERVLGLSDEWQGVLFNGVLGAAAQYLEIIPNKIKWCWFVWGFELYGLKYPASFGLLESKTFKFAISDLWGRGAGRLVRPLILKLMGSLSSSRRVLKRMSYVVTHLEAEYELFNSWGYLERRNKWHEAPVIRLSSLIDCRCDTAPAPDGRSMPDILVGNSATPANNHVDVFERLSHLDLVGRKVVVPLSYGKPSYREFVIKHGERLLGDHFCPILEFLPLNEYLSRIESCGSVIMNLHRQQAVGNIIAALWAGRNVYLGNSSVLTSYQKKGLNVFSYQNEFDLERELPSEGELKARRKVIESMVGAEAVFRSISNLLENLSSN